MLRRLSSGGGGWMGMVRWEGERRWLSRRIMVPGVMFSRGKGRERKGTVVGVGESLGERLVAGWV